MCPFLVIRISPTYRDPMRVTSRLVSCMAAGSLYGTNIGVSAAIAPATALAPHEDRADCSDMEIGWAETNPTGAFDPRLLADVAMADPVYRCALGKWYRYHPDAMMGLGGNKPVASFSMAKLGSDLGVVIESLKREGPEGLFVTYFDTKPALRILLGREMADGFIKERLEHIGVETMEFREALWRARGFNLVPVTQFRKLDLYFLVGVDQAEFLMRKRALYVYYVSTVLGSESEIAQMTFENIAEMDIKIRAVRDRLDSFTVLDPFLSMPHRKEIGIILQSRADYRLSLQARYHVARTLLVLRHDPSLAAMGFHEVIETMDKPIHYSAVVLEKDVAALTELMEDHACPELKPELIFLYGTSVVDRMLRFYELRGRAGEPRAVTTRGLDDVDFEAASRIIAALADLRAANIEKIDDSSNCPPVTIPTMTQGDVMISGYPDFRGSGSLVWISADRLYAVKAISKGGVIKEALMVEKAVGSVIGDLGGDAVHYYPQKPGIIPKLCAQCVLVTDYAGEYTFKDVGSGGPIEVTEAEVAGIAVRAIKILKKIHAMGIVHGDVHAGNFVFSGADSVDRLHFRIIDFGRASPYVDPTTRSHIKHRFTITEASESLLSLFEIEDSNLSRRDDMYRLAEILYHLLGKYHEPKFSENNTALAKRKMVANGVNAIFTDFHHAMVEMKFDERPAYDEWIQRFSSVAAGI